jgi:hypothetical protein
MKKVEMDRETLNQEDLESVTTFHSRLVTNL